MVMLCPCPSRCALLSSRACQLGVPRLSDPAFRPWTPPLRAQSFAIALCGKSKSSHPSSEWAAGPPSIDSDRQRDWGRQEGTGRTQHRDRPPASPLLCHSCHGCLALDVLQYRSACHPLSARVAIDVDVDVQCMLPHLPPSIQLLFFCTARSPAPAPDRDEAAEVRRRKWPRTINANCVESPLVPSRSFVDNPCNSGC